MRTPPNGVWVIYVIEAGDCYKIGITAAFSRRIATIQTHCPTPVSCAAYRTIPTDRRLALEKQVHVALSPHRVHGEWFRVDLPTIRAAIRDVLRKAYDERPWAMKRGHCDPEVWFGHRT